MIITKEQILLNKFDLWGNSIVVSGGYDPLHRGHIQNIYGAWKVGLEICRLRTEDVLSGKSIDNRKFNVVAIVNCDDFLLRKKGYKFQDEEERAFIVDSLKWVDYTYIHQSDNQFIHEALNLIRPSYLAKGGDRSSSSQMPQEEIEACDKYGIEILYGIGGTDKVASSSEIVKKETK